MNSKKCFFFLLLWATTLCAEEPRYVEIESLGFLLNDSAHTAELVPIDGIKWSGFKEIPASVSDNGISYVVTAIGELAFYQNSDLTSVAIPDCVTRIETLAFAGCSALQDVQVYWSADKLGTIAYPADTASVFRDVICANVTLHVPYGTQTSYKADKLWKQFNVVERQDGPTAIESVVDDPSKSTRKVLSNGIIFILRDDKTYTLQGLNF